VTGSPSRAVLIAHLTTVHRPDDPRVALKECASLQRAGYDVVLIHARGRETQTPLPIRTRRIRASRGRLGRMTVDGTRLLRAALAERADLHHFHDPELVPIGLALKAAGHRVVYDVHEDVPRQIRYKPYLPAPLKPVAGWLAEAAEAAGALAFDAIVAATPHIAGRFPARKTVVVQNFPVLEELSGEIGPPYGERSRHVVYVGRITPEAGALEMAEAARLITSADSQVTLAGPMPDGLRAPVLERAAPAAVRLPGWQDREQVAALLGSARVGLVTLHPEANYLDSYPTKMFEYMAAGVPVVASDFPLWRGIVEGAACGIIVNPLHPKEIADAVDWLLRHPDEARAMGERGRAAVATSYNWLAEERKLLDLYARLLGDGAQLAGGGSSSGPASSATARRA
jgi:glycosyltransferase involved in cell wall biosynthesis